MEEKIRELASIVGEQWVIIDPDIIESYTHDETLYIKNTPLAVIKPANTEEVKELVKWAIKYKVPVTARGGGTGLSGGAVPLPQGLVISLERMNRIIEIDEDNLMAVVEPGVITQDLAKAVEGRGLLYAPDPASLDSCTIGGNIAEGAGGPRTVKYGTTKDYVKGLEVVLPTGEVLNLGGKLVKDVVSAKLIPLFISQEGTLGIITKAILKLLPLPEYTLDILVPFGDMVKAGEAVSTIVRKKIVPAVIEFIDNNAIQAASKFLKRELPFCDAEAHLFIEVDGNYPEILEKEIETIGEICFELGAYDVFLADNKQDKERLWESRRCLHEAMVQISPTIAEEDVVVPRSKIPHLIQFIRQIEKEDNLHIITFGHAGDGNVHVNILKRDIPDNEWAEISRRTIEKIFKFTVELGGTISGEHGIGLDKREFLNIALQSEAIELIRKIKRTLDPYNIMNPGKIVEV